jgi:Do/DeqQ family serine protease
MRQSTFDSQIPKPSSSPLKKMAAYLSLLLLGAGVGVGGVYYLGNPQSLTRSLQTPTLAQNNERPNNSVAPAIATPTNFVTEVVNRVGPAVVRINASRTVTTQVPEMFNDPFFRNFFGSQIPSVPDKQVQRGLGSGFILSADGEIITNAHVVDGADEVSVTLKDGRTYKGRVLGTDPVTDVAVVKIDAENLPTVQLGNADSLQVGEWAIAIGNPLGLDNTVTTGIVSGTGRNSSQIGVGDKRVNFIQTDAAINPGNSGGPLLNARGEVIGVNTAIIQNAQGLGFAIPINKAQEIAEQLIAKGRVEHAYLGIQMAPITPELKQALKENEGWTVEGDQGILIVRVVPNSPADRAGLRAGDIIQSINGQSVDTPNQVQDAVEKTAVGNTLPLTIQRNGETANLDVRVGVLPNQNS